MEPKAGRFFSNRRQFLKISLRVTLAKYLAEKESLNSYVDFIVPFIYVGIPTLLIVIQPSLGTALVFIFFTFIMMYIAGAPGKKLLIIILAGILSVSSLFLAY